MEGLVLRSTGSFYDVLAADGEKHRCRIRGKIRLEGISETNPVAVGDRVTFETGVDVGSITSILPRTNHMMRLSVKKTSHAHVLAANIDHALLVATISLPRTSNGFIDRFLVSAEAYRIPQVIVFNKRDLLTEEELEIQGGLMHIYETVGIRCLAISAQHDDVSEIRNLLGKKTTLVAGHSGVGKSTLLNRIDPRINQKTAEVSSFSEKGTHTTTFAEMFQLDTNTFVIDTPGVKEWGLVDMNEQELSDYFPEMRDRRLECKFGARCLHVNEPKCAILESVDKGEISILRYESYLSMLAGDDNRR